MKLDESVISGKEFLEKISVYFFTPKYYSNAVSNKEVKEIIQKEKTRKELQEQIEQIKNKQYFKEDDIQMKIMKMIVDIENVNIQLLHVLINLFPQTIFIFKNNLIDIINCALNQGQNINQAGNFIQNVFEIVSIDQEFLQIYKTCMTTKLKDMIQSDAHHLKLIETSQLIFPMDKKYQRLVINFLSQQIKFCNDQTKNYSETNALRWNLDYFNNVIYYKESQNESRNILEEANKVINENLSKHLGELLQDKKSFLAFYSEYENLIKSIQDKESIFTYHDIIIQRDFYSLENLIESNASEFQAYHQQIQALNQPLKALEQQETQSKGKADTYQDKKSKGRKSLPNNIPIRQIKGEEKKKQSDDEWEDDEDDDDDDGDVVEHKENVINAAQQQNKSNENQTAAVVNQDEEEWEDEEGVENEDDEDITDNDDDDDLDDFNLNKQEQGKGKGKEEEDEDSSDYDHEGEKKQSGKKSKDSPKSDIKDQQSNQITQIPIVESENNKLTVNEKTQLSPHPLREEKKINDASQEDDFTYLDEEQKEEEQKDEDAMGEENYFNDFNIQLENDGEDNEEDDDEEEDNETTVKAKEDWNKYIILRERWSAARYINIDKKECEQVKQQLFLFLRELKRQKDKIDVFIDIVKQLDEDELRKYLHTKFPKQIALKATNTSSKKKKLETIKLTNKQPEDNKNNKDDNDDADFVDDDEDEEDEERKQESRKGSNNDENDNGKLMNSNQSDAEEEEEDEEEEDLGEGNLLHISSSEEGLDSEDEEGEFDEDGDEFDEDGEDNSSLFNQYYGENSNSDSENEEEEEEEEHDHNNSQQNKSLNDRQWSPVVQIPSQSNLINLYIDNLVFYDEKAIENIVKSFYSGSFNNQIISNELLNPIHGPQLMDALFFLLVNPQLDQYQEIKQDKEFDFLLKLGENQLFTKNYLVFYDNSMSFFRNALCSNQSKQLLAYFTLDVIHWSYLPQLSIIKKLKQITNHSQMSGLQTLIMLFGDKFKFEDIYENKKQIMVLNQISKYIKSTHIVLDQNGEDTPSQSQITIFNPVIRQIDIDNILHYYYFENEHFSNKFFLFSFLQKGLQKEPKYNLVILQQFLESQSKFLVQDVIDLMNKGISDVKRILEQNELNSKKFALSHLYEIFSDTESNPIYDSLKCFAANLRSLMRIFFKKVKKLKVEDQKGEMINLQEVLNNQSLMKFFTQILKQLQYLHANIIAPTSSGSTSVIDNDENGELQQIFSPFIPIVKLMYMLHPYYDIENNNIEQPILEQVDSLPELSKISSKQQSSAQYESVPSNKLIEIVNEEDKVLKVDEFKKILEQGFCQVIKLFVGMDDQLFQKYIKVVSKDPQNLKSLDLDTRIFAIQAKAVKRAEHIQNNSGEIITLKIDRKCVFEDTFRTIMRQKPNQLIQKQFEVKFRKEDGIDQSGLTREWYSCISKELFDPRKGLFLVASNKYIIYPSTTSYLVPDHINIFKFTGQIIAKSILEGYLIGIDFPKFFLKHLTGSPLKISDLDDIEPELSKNLLWILENPVEDLCLTYIYEYNEMGEKKTIELLPDGKNIEVTDINKKEYVDKLINYVMIKQIQPQTQAFLEGFFNIFPKSELYLVDWMELGMKMAGAQEIDFKELRANTSYQGGYSEISTLINWFWEILMSFDDKMKRNFLFFLSGSYKIPLGGYKDMGFTICKIFDTQNLPVAHTCFNQLDLPQYEDKETLQKKLYQAILEGNDSFGIA